MSPYPCVLQQTATTPAAARSAALPLRAQERTAFVQRLEISARDTTVHFQISPCAYHAADWDVLEFSTISAPSARTTSQGMPGKASCIGILYSCHCMFNSSGVPLSSVPAPTRPHARRKPPVRGSNLPVNGAGTSDPSQSASQRRWDIGSQSICESRSEIRPTAFVNNLARVDGVNPGMDSGFSRDSSHALGRRFHSRSAAQQSGEAERFTLPALITREACPSGSASLVGCVRCLSKLDRMRQGVRLGVRLRMSGLSAD